jgi:hypothetical protein
MSDAGAVHFGGKQAEDGARFARPLRVKSKWSPSSARAADQGLPRMKAVLAPVAVPDLQGGGLDFNWAESKPNGSD